MKKGISPLIATVIIIGMTISIASLIILFGKDFLEKTTQKVDVESDEKTICMQEVIFEIKSACYMKDDPQSIRLVIFNNGVKDINKFYARFYKSENEVLEDNIKETIKSSGSGSLEFYVGSTGIKQVDLFPMIRRSFKSITCANNIASYGNYLGASLVTCTS